MCSGHSVFFHCFCDFIATLTCWNSILLCVTEPLDLHITHWIFTCRLKTLTPARELNCECMGFTDTEQLQGCYVDKQQRGEAETNLHMYTITVVEFDFKPYAGVTFIKEKYTFLLFWLQKSYFNMHVNIYLQLHDHDVYMCASYVSLFCYRKSRKLSNCWHKPAKHWLSPSAYVSNTIYPPPSWPVHL